MFKNIKVVNDEPLIEDVLREINRGAWTIGYTGQSPERLKLHAKHRRTFDTTHAEGRRRPLQGRILRPALALLGQPGDEASRAPRYSTIPANPWPKAGLSSGPTGERNTTAKTCWPSGVYSEGSEIKDGYPEFTADILKKLGWWNDLTPDEKKEAEGKNWKTDLSGGIQRVVIKHGCAPFGNGRARCHVWTYPDPIPVHREPLYTPRFDLVKKYPTYPGPQGLLAAAHPLPVDPVGQPQHQISAHLHQRPAGRIRRRRRGDSAPSRGSPNCSRRCSRKSTRKTPPTPAS